MSEVRALLLTDVVDSARITATAGDLVMAAHWESHDRAARDLLRTWRGLEIERTDGLLAIFEDVKNAAGFALDYQRAMHRLHLPFKFRAGLHVGPIILRRNSAMDIAVGANKLYIDGFAKSVVARVTSLALGGQTLVTADAHSALHGSDAHFQSHGHWRLKGVHEPIELFEIGDTLSPFAPPSDELKAYRVVRHDDIWRPARDISHNLPGERDRFVGRHESLRQIATLYERGARLVSILGIGGIGKTRLVRRFARTWLGDFPGGAWFCDLSQARSVDGIAFAVAQGLDVPLGKLDPVIQLGDAIAGRGDCLVILDNFEQVARHAEETLGCWLERAPDARFLVTTREVLGVVGEELLELPPLPVSDAVTLFLSRAQSASKDFTPVDNDLGTIEELVKVLDGLPLAIELASARIRLMSPRLLLTNMRERFKLLVSRGRCDRQATLRATFDWSWDLLDEVEKSALAQLSVFESGFTFESAQAVLTLPETAIIVDVIQSLADKSLFRRVSDGRFDFLESVRVYAAKQLRSESGFAGSGIAAATAAEQRHGIYFAKLGSRRAVEHACAEIDNLIAACQRAVTRIEPQIAANALAGAWVALKLRGPFRAGVEISGLVQSIALPPSVEATVCRIRGSALMLSGQTAEAREQLELAVSKSTEFGNATTVAQALASLGELSIKEGRIAEALENYKSALACAPGGDVAFECAALSAIGLCNEYLGELDAAEKYHIRTLNLSRDAGERRWEGGALGNLGQLHANRGRSKEALQCYESAIAIARELGDRQWEGNVRCNLGLFQYSEGALGESICHLHAALDCARELGYPRLECVVLCNLGIVLEEQGHCDDARRRYIEAVELARILKDRRSEGQFLGYLGRFYARRGTFYEAKKCIESGETLLRAVADRVSLGVLLCAKAETAHLAGEESSATDVFGDAEQLAQELAVEPKSELGVALNRVRSLIRAM